MSSPVTIPTGYKVTDASPADHEAIIDLLNNAFSRILLRLCGGAPDIGEGDRIRSRLSRGDCHGFVLRNQEEEVVGVSLIQLYGRQVVLGPIAIRAATPGKEVLFATAHSYMREHGLEHIDFVTFPHSTLHFKAYWTANQALDVGLIPISPALVLTRRLRPDARPSSHSDGPLSWLSQSTFEAREAQLQAIHKLNLRSPGGLDNERELRHVLAEKYGDVLLCGTELEPQGYAVCMWGPGSEAFESRQMLVKVLLVDAPSLAGNTHHLSSITTAIEGMAQSQGLREVGMMVNALHRDMLNALLARDYRISSIFQHWTTRGANYTNTSDLFCAMELR